MTTMTRATGTSGTPSHRVDSNLRPVARATGLLYLAFFVVGLAGTLVVKAQLFDAADPVATLADVRAHETLARAGVALELGIAVVQALTALSFYRLFRTVDTFAAWALAALGMVNAAAILGSAALLGTTLQVSADTTPSVGGGAAGTVQVLYLLSGNVWSAAAAFFGLWLLPMGWLVLGSQWLPRPLGWLLLVAGAGYLLSAFVGYLFSGADVAVQLLQVPSIVAELWITACLLLVGFRRENGPK